MSAMTLSWEFRILELKNLKCHVSIIHLNNRNDNGGDDYSVKISLSIIDIR